MLNTFQCLTWKSVEATVDRIEILNDQDCRGCNDDDRSGHGFRFFVHDHLL